MRTKYSVVGLLAHVDLKKIEHTLTLLSKNLFQRAVLLALETSTSAIRMYSEGLSRLGLGYHSYKDITIDFKFALAAPHVFGLYCKCTVSI